jgi:uncharacterized protein with GYD domain
MQIYVLMTKMASKEAGLVEVGLKLRDRAHGAREWLDQVKALCPQVKFLAHYALLGYWDFMDIYEAPDEETAAKVSLLSRANGAHMVESWTAIPYDKIVQLSEEIETIQELNL